jgi:hypothetical protein
MTSPAAMAPQQLARRREALIADQAQQVARVEALASQGHVLGEALQADLGALQTSGHQLDDLAAAKGGLQALLGIFTRRRTALQRRSISEDLRTRYAAVEVGLQRASRFCDDLQLCALQLQDELDGLHVERRDAQAAESVSATRVLDLAREQDQLSALPDGERAREADRLSFAMRQAGLELQLLRAQVRLLDEHLPQARQLRDTSLTLHEELAAFVLQAGDRVVAAGRRIQALGVAADAPLVVAELQESLHDLDRAMAATDQTLATSAALIADVLPELRRHLVAKGAADRWLEQQEFGELDLERARALADRALADAAASEVEGLGRNL